MAADNNIKNFTAADIEKYHKGLLSAKERHDLEKAALDDPFLADALEGYAVAGVNVPADIADLEQRLAERTGGAKVVPMQGGRKTFSPFLRAAAMIIVLIGAGLLVYQFAFNKKEKNEVAQVKQTAKTATTTTDTTPSGIRSESNTQGPASEETGKGKLKDNGAGPVGNAKDGNTAPAAPGTEVAGEKHNEAAPVTSDLKTVTTGGAPVSSTATNVPVKATEVSDGIERSAGKNTDKELAREESKTRAISAKKQQADKDVPRGITVTPSDEARNKRDVTLSKQGGDDQYYRNQAMNTFRGRVTDASNVGLPFANVTNVQDNVGTYTDANGNFILTSPDTVLNVQIRSLGYDNNNIQLRNNIPANQVVMQEDRKGLSEVVVSNQKPNAAARSKDDNRKLIEPEPVDGWVKYDSYLANNLNVPEDFSQQKTNNNNSVQVSFEVDKNGEPVNIRVEKSLCSSCDKEAIRLIKDGPKWKRNAGKKGRTTVTINF